MSKNAERLNTNMKYLTICEKICEITLFVQDKLERMLIVIFIHITLMA